MKTTVDGAPLVVITTVPILFIVVLGPRGSLMSHFSDPRFPQRQHQGSSRFCKLRSAIEDGRPLPVDLRYLRGAGASRITGDDVRPRIITFLEQVYNSQAETLPDVRDDPSSSLFVKNFAPDPYAEALLDDAVPEHRAAAQAIPKLRKLRKLGMFQNYDVWVMLIPNDASLMMNNLNLALSHCFGIHGSSAVMQAQQIH